MEQREMDRLDRLVAALQREIDEQERALYSATVLHEARHPQNLGRMAGPDAHAVVTGWCGDTMEVFLRLDGDVIREAAFLTNGCGPSVACGSKLTALVRGMTPEEASRLRPEDLIAALDGLPDESAHCAELAVSTLRKAIAGRHKQEEDSR
jgi:nitrogen fixation NifU-like protein